MHKSRYAWFAMVALSLPAFADEQRQAMITGRGGSPKCTIEVVVDGAADVQVRGTMATIHTLQGAPATFRRFECNQPMPDNPGNFRFSGVDGRGRQTLIGNPRGNGPATVRIEDPAGGSEGYTFDLEWNGQGGDFGRGPGGGGFDGGPGRGPGPGPGGPPAGGGGFGGGFERDAVRGCGNAAEDRLHVDGFRDTRVVRAGVEDGPGRNDWISGIVVGRRGGPPREFRFSCRFDLRSGRVGEVNVERGDAGGPGPGPGPGAGPGRPFGRDEALRACGDAVQDRMRRDGFDDTRITGMDVDNRPGRNDWIRGSLVANRGRSQRSFDFACSVDFRSGAVRSVQVDRR